MSQINTVAAATTSVNYGIMLYCVGVEVTVTQITVIE